MPKFDFNKDAKQLNCNHTFAWVFSCKFAAFFRTPLPKNTSEGVASEFTNAGVLEILCSILFGI